MAASDHLQAQQFPDWEKDLEVHEGDAHDVPEHQVVGAHSATSKKTGVWPAKVARWDEGGM